MNIFTEEFREKLEQTDDNEEITIEQLEAEYALIQESRELISKIEGRIGRPDVVFKLRDMNNNLEWLQGSMHHTKEKLENE